MDKTKLLAQLKAEIDNDPAGLGYNGKTAKEIADLINTPIKIVTDIIEPSLKIAPKPGDIIGTKEEIKDPRVFQVIGGIPGAPNGVTPEDVTEALK